MLIPVSCQLCCVLGRLKIQSENENMVESKGIKDLALCLGLFLQNFNEMENKVYEMLSE